MKKISDFLKLNTKYLCSLFFLFILLSCSDKDSSDSEDTPPSETIIYDIVSTYKTIDVVDVRGVETSKKWGNTTTLKIKFLNGSVEEQDRVKSISQQWANYANVKFEYVDKGEKADVKIAFSWNDDEISWAYVGVDNKQIEQDAPSMNIPLSINGNELELGTKSFEGMILRSFGHILGFVYENEGLKSGEELDQEKLKTYLEKQNWDSTEIDKLISIYNKSQSNNSEIDENSVMKLFVPSAFLLNDLKLEQNNTLSIKDKRNTKISYPLLEKKIDLLFSMDDGKTTYPYSAVLIGEYYWIDNNFYHPVPKLGGIFDAGGEVDTPITTEMIDTYMKAIHMDLSNKNVKNFPKQVYNLDNFNRYYGKHYNRMSIIYMDITGKMYEDGEAIHQWELPSYVDYRQLFGMCPVGDDKVLSNNDVQVALAAKYGDNPGTVPYYVETHDKLIFGENTSLNICKDANGPAHHAVYWNSQDLNGREVQNIYGLNLMAGGARGNASWVWSNGLYDIEKDIKDQSLFIHDGVGQYLYHLFYTVNLYTKEASITIHDYIDTKNPYSYHWFNARWCRRLTDQELGYKLYINSAQTDIIKLDITETPPQGYTELEKGYLRGFYVQYILNNPSPKYTIADIVYLSKHVEDQTLKWG